MSGQKHINELADESSPYLLQHANNPVNWYPWGEEALNKALEENKPILLSIGYSSCHWCHVMAHESFENEEVAKIMNGHFINIKLDREERPDIDNIYMDAIQAMGLRGGWPLNVFLTPDQKPFYGGTYFPKEQWKSLLTSINDAYLNKYDDLYSSASKFAERINQSESEKYGLGESQIKLNSEDFDKAFLTLSSKFDSVWGGMDKAPKFPMPALWNFSLAYSHANENQEALNHTLFTLDKIANGGIYDHVGGGFSRYSVDGEWHVPHFEKMLYDNGQLLGLYADAYRLTGEEDYASVVLGIANWLEREMTSDAGGFYSALDADSEGEEGKFYVWSWEEFTVLAGEDLSILAEYYDVSKTGNWEHGKNVLRKLAALATTSKELNISKEALLRKVQDFNSRALIKRSERIRPGLDSKILAGWNGLMLSGLCKSYQAIDNDNIKALAQRNAVFIKEELIRNEKLLRVYGKSTEGFLEDYSAIIQAFINYYETFFDESYLRLAKQLTDRAIKDFYDVNENLFYYSSTRSEDLIARKKELFDNVIPSSNSTMAENLYKLGIMFDEDSYKEKASLMVNQVNTLIKQEPEYLSNWANVSLMMSNPTAEILIVGEEAYNMAKTINEVYLPNKVIMASGKNSDLPLFEYKKDPTRSTIYVCYEKVCKQPVFEADKAILEIRRK